MTEEMEIDLKDLLYTILKKWRMILVYCIIFTIITNIASIGLSALDIRKSKKELSKQAEELLELRGELTDREIEEVSEVYDNYKRLRDSAELIEEYNNNSVIMQIEPNKVPTVKLRYNIDTHYKVEYPVISEKDYTGELMSEYRSILNSDSVVSEIAVALSNDAKPEYVRELVETSSESSSIMQISVIAPEKQQCEQMAEVIKNIVENKKSEIGNKYGDYDLNIVDEAYTEEVRTDILENQQSRYSKGDAIRNSLASLGSKLSPDQSAYYKALIEYETAKEQKQVIASKKRELLGADSKTAEGEKAYTSEIAEENDLSYAEDMLSEEAIYEDASISFISIKFMVIGFVLGGIIACGVICCGYLFVPVLRTADTMSNVFSVSLIDNVWIKDEKKKAFSFIDDFIDRLFYGKALKIDVENKIKLVIDKTNIFAHKNGYNRIHLTGASDEELEIIKKISAEIKPGDANNKGTVTFGGLVSEDRDSLISMSNSDAVVLIEGVNGSRIDDIVKEIEIINKAKVNILGSVVINRY